MVSKVEPFPITLLSSRGHVQAGIAYFGDSSRDYLCRDDDFFVICDIALSHLSEKRGKTLSEQPMLFVGATQIAEVVINPPEADKCKPAAGG
jgi:hypothetical protein